MERVYALLKLTLTFGISLVQRGWAAPQSNGAIKAGQMKNLVTFGDSYTDTSFYPSDDGGYSWPTYVAGYGPFNLYGFARVGATCSNNLTDRPFPPLMEYQLPDYLNATRNGTIPPSSILPHETTYAIWIGTNDVGANALLTQGVGVRKGVSIVEVRKCVVDVVRVLYESGARYFVIMNMIPLNLTPLYSPDSYPSVYWTAPRNRTEWSVFMHELVRAGNAITDLLLQVAAPSFDGAHIASFDAFALFADMYTNPSAYLNGTTTVGNTTVPVYNVTGSIDACVLKLNESTADPGTCTVVEGPARDGYLWWDELHPSEQADRIVAREITAVMKGEYSRWTTWLS
ncbi:carbohydrate esterase family 16 protein [Pisolithus thermaeus]|nr:carbohydrate esterase family 16 protein [Pisolithus croceorrhizus]KAI6169604.1 carbohydrate esterase family 16 protein [Pisolithus thermaeus]